MAHPNIRIPYTHARLLRKVHSHVVITVITILWHLKAISVLTPCAYSRLSIYIHTYIQTKTCGNTAKSGSWANMSTHQHTSNRYRGNNCSNKINLLCTSSCVCVCVDGRSTLLTMPSAMSYASLCYVKCIYVANMHMHLRLQ